MPEPEASAEHLAAASFHTTRAQARLTASRITEPQARAYVRLCAARKELRTPIQYLVGDWDFHAITIKVRAPVLIPRPETEQLVEFILRDARALRGGRILDVGCGSGAIILALLNKLGGRGVKGVALDLCQQAVDLTIENAKLLQLPQSLLQVQYLQGGIADYESAELFDVLVSNPPYIPDSDMHGLPREVGDHEATVALAGGVDGLCVVRQILKVAPTVVRKAGKVWMEVDSSHPAILQEMTFPGLEFKQRIKDCYGRDRFVQWDVL